MTHKHDLLAEAGARLNELFHAKIPEKIDLSP